MVMIVAGVFLLCHAMTFGAVIMTSLCILLPQHERSPIVLDTHAGEGILKLSFG